MRNFKLSIFSVVTLLFVLLSNISCKNKNEFTPLDSAFASYISSYTSGVISSKSSIKIRLSEAVEASETDNLFSFSPTIKGTTRWIDNRTVEFIPEEKLPSGKFYDAEFSLGKLKEVSKDLKLFKFNFQAITQHLTVQLSKISSLDTRKLDFQKVEGSIQASDVTEINELANAFSAKINQTTFPIQIKEGSNPNLFTFSLDSIPRGKKNETLKIYWDSGKLDLDKSGQLDIEIQALGNFKIVQTRIYQQPKQYISILFSDPLLTSQNLNGLITITGQSPPKFSVDENEIKVYPSRNLTGTHTITIQDIRNTASRKLETAKEIEVQFEDIKPSIELLGKGVIIPDSNGIIFPFKAVNLKAVNIKVLKIYEENVAQFLQVNQVNGQNELKRVGRTIHKSTMDLRAQKSINFGKWNAFAVQLDKLIDPEPGAIYRVELSFGIRQSLYGCETTTDTSENENNSINNNSDRNDDNWENNYDEYSYWDGYEGYENQRVDYSQRDNPCNPAYYRYNTSKVKVARNVLASNLGIIAKLGNNKKMIVAVTDILTTKPISDVGLEVLNYQMQQTVKGKTNNKGLSELSVDNNPFLLIASKGDQKGYVRLDNASSLSTSKFDVSGTVIQKGLKGFIYGERGVWRPGDTLFLNFMLQDKDQLLPENHPVSFELLNPEGKIIQSITTTKGVGDIYNFTTKTDAEAITGNWMARVKVGGSIFSKRIKIETVKPNRLKIALDFGKKQLSKNDKNIKGTLSAKWLHGAIAKNLKADVKVSLHQIPTVFPRYKDYVFDDPGHTFKSEELSLFNGKLSSEGTAPISADIEINNNSPGMLKANFSTKVFEEGGDFSVDRFSIPYAPYKKFVGIQLPKGDKTRGMLLTDIDHPIKIITVDDSGKPVNSKVKIDIYKIEWRYWWEKNSNEDLSNYIGSDYKKPIHSAYATTNNGIATSNFQVNYPEWGRYYVRVTDQNSGHTTGKIIYIDWPGWAGRASKDNPGGASMLVLSTDKTDYSVGETVTVTVPTSEGSRALVSIESGSKVVETYWLETAKETTTFRFIATAEMAPNVYVNVTVLQPHNSTKNDLPIRLYGITPINVEDPETRITPTLKMADELHPEEVVTLQVGEAKNQAMEYTVAIVDEGLLDITRFKTPNPWKQFYARESLGVRSWDMYEYVLGAYAGEISGLLQIGGDDLIGKKEGEKANRFKPVVKFLGPFTLQKGKTNTHSFKMPPYVGSVKTMIVASHKGAYGIADKAIPVKQPLMVLATLPRVISPTEKVKLPVTVFAMDKNLKNVTIEVKHNNMLLVEGSKTKKLQFSEPGEQLTTFDITTPNAIGVAKIEIIARSGGLSATHTIELDVRQPNPPSTQVVEKVIDAGQSWNPNFEINGIKGTNKAYIEVSNIPAINLEERLRYLITYPHGCVEQTTSSGFPQLYLGDIMNLNEADAVATSKNITATINKLLQFQNHDGGFVYWPGHSNTDDWGSSYVGHFLLEAKSKGFSMPDGMISKWVTYQKNSANRWTLPQQNSTYYYHRSDMLQAYRLYTLALAGKPEMGAMNRLKEKGSLSTQALWRLAAAYTLAGQIDIAKQLVFGKSMEIAPYREMGYSYGSNDRDDAMILETLILLNEKEKAATLLKKIANKMSGKNWMSTQTTAYALIAVSKFITNNKTGEQMRFNFNQNGGKTRELISAKPISKQNLSVTKQTNQLSFSNKTGGILFARIITEGVPIVSDNIKDENNDLVMDIKYLNLNNQLIDPKSIPQGTDFKVEVRLKNPGYKGAYSQMALTQMFPSGWEIQNIRMDNVGGKHLKDTPDYMDIRDDRVHYYFDLQKGESKTFVTLLNASYLGKFYQPSVYCEAMYDNTINARRVGNWVEVVRQ